MEVQNPSTPHIVVIGAGVIGLTTTIVLQESLPEAKITVVASHFPEDGKSIDYSSCWAGAHHITVVNPGLQRDLEIETFKKLWLMAHDDCDAPLLVLPHTELYEDEMSAAGARDRLREFMPDFKVIEKADLPNGVKSGVSFTTVTLDTPNYLDWLVGKVQAHGGTFVKRHVDHIDKVVRDFSPSLVINCIGMGCRNLGGVDDVEVYPTSGQTVLITAPWVRVGITRSGNGVLSYVIPRKSGDVILGGTKEDNHWGPIPNPETAASIMRRTLAICPDILPPDKRAMGRIEDLVVIEHGCGLRPSRKGGIRIELDLRSLKDANGQALPLIHNYGHGGAGYQSSWGSARMAVDLVMSQLHKPSMRGN